MTRALFKSVDLFHKLNQEELQQLVQVSSRVIYEIGETILIEDTPGEYLFIIEKGKVRVLITTPEGEEITLTFLREGDFFGEMALFTEKERCATVLAVKKTTLLKLHRRDFMEILKDHFSITQAVLSSLCERLHQANQMIYSLNHLSVAGRVAAYLQTLAEQEGVKEGDYICVTRPTHQEMANLLGASRETISRILNAMENQKLISCKGRKIYIPFGGLSEKSF